MEAVGSRWSYLRVPADTGLYTPLHLQPAAVCRLAFSAAGLWLSQHLVSHRRLVTEHRTGLVFWSVELVYGDRVSFFDDEEVGVEVTARVRAGGTQFESVVALGPALSGGVSRARVNGGEDAEGGFHPQGKGARLRACLVPLRLDDDLALAGAPGRLSDELMALIRPQELEELPHRSPVPRLRAEIAAQALPLARIETPFVVHRHQCEVADQWFWPEAVSLAGGGREELVRSEAERMPALLQGMRVPMERLDVLFQRPYFLFEEGVVVSTAYEWCDRLAFVHEFVDAGVGSGGRPRAVAIERFPEQPRP